VPAEDFLCVWQKAATGGAKFAVALSGLNKIIVFENSISQGSSLALIIFA
jgi:hypothetical protein